MGHFQAKRVSCQVTTMHYKTEKSKLNSVPPNSRNSARQIFQQSETEFSPQF